ncbi:MAG TPA: DUF3267 domain-containing protein [Anaerolineae bacterium]|nr:DUF3267 domain-containing protein [Anaerolineae bacterium]HIP69978.1 DUF3267 domain-containing protein [Anaerolineae bacterium]
MSADERDEHGYDVTVSMGKANAIAFAMIPAAFALFYLPYWWIWGPGSLWQFSARPFLDFLLFMAAFAVGIVVHEGLHALGFIWIGKAPRSSIRFGILWRSLAPYAHCNAAVTATAYRWTLALPGLALGVLPAVLGIVLGNWRLMVYGALMFMAAGGDTAVLLAIRSLPGETLVKDHPSKVGCSVIGER